MPHLLRAGLAAALLCLGGSALAAEGPAPAPPAAQSFRLGQLQLTALRDGAWLVPNDGTVFGSDPAAAAKLLAAAGAPTDTLTLNVGVLLVRLPGHVVLLDAGLGPKDHGVLPASLALVGVKAADITDVLITHHHLDHTGGLAAADGKPAFPNATVWMSAREWTAMQADRETKALAAAIAARVKTFEPGRPILAGVTPVALYGHTPGHAGYEIASGSARLDDIGDLAHSSILNLERPDWADKYDDDPAAGAAMRLAELKRLAASHQLVFAPHFPFPGVGRIVATGDHFVWAPLDPANGMQH
jgi:glyoxylase-like metal-dependent hydrolase (beta-lactamase superfamily II)